MGILDFGFWILDFGFWILDFGFWIGYCLLILILYNLLLSYLSMPNKATSALESCHASLQRRTKLAICV
ncbi:hypothetical protein WA1_04555 [Scytonema hofmannii PCC 7110]|uniref:Uncharacterized protein n=1 Tax=Scytonema hofmannii PCC 7110 TaxID=128403 RepID=A0A139WZE9_9CYAN|nr:hypothetical protein WA1_04555 [Scytonema hofmannii PCC 7110]